MEHRIIPILVTVVLILIGHITMRIARSDYIKRKQFTVSFQNNFISLIKDFGATHSLNSVFYERCIHDVDKIQEELDGAGVIAEFIDPLSGIRGRNYQLFMNILPELRKLSGMLDNIIVANRCEQLIGLCDDALQRHEGNLDRAIDQISSQLWNPIACLGNGMRWIIWLPGNIFEWAGIISTQKVHAVHQNRIVKFIENVIVIIGLVGSVFTIILGWNDMIDLIVRFLKMG